MANKARYYGLAKQNELNDVNIGGRAYTNDGVLSYSAVTTAIRNYKADHPNFDSLSSTVAADRIAKVLSDTGLYGRVTASGARITDGQFSIALTKARNGNGTIVASQASIQIDEDKKRKK